MPTAILPSQPSFLKKNLFLGVTISTVLVIVIMAFSFGLHMYNIQSIGDANAYYTAAVKSMLQSWSNFFFAAAEPGGSVTVDKPPLGLWIEAVFAYFLGVSGFSVSLPNILAGVFGIPLLYVMVKKYMGELAGLVAALIMVITPVFVATNRNNTMDGMLVFTLLLAAWAFIQATESGKLRWLLLGAFIVGLGFNIKMMQAFLPLPAFYALYFFGSKEGWIRKIINLGIATVLLLAVSLTWAVVVDLTPADQRPYIGSSHDNTVMGLILGHNGGSRLFGGRSLLGDGPQNRQNPGQNQSPLAGSQPSPALAPGASVDQTQGELGQTPNEGTQPQPGVGQGLLQMAVDACASSTQGASCSFTAQNGNTINGTCVTPLNSTELACAPQGAPSQNGQSSLGQAPRQGPPQEALDACASTSQGAPCSFTMPFGTVNGTCNMPPNLDQLACAPQGMIPQNGQGPLGQAPSGGPNGQGGGTPFSQETGSPGVFRFFTQPLSRQMSWLLPFALISVLLALIGSPLRVKLPIESGVHKALVLWGGWLLTCVVFFSMVSGIFHSYYAIMLAPALGAMVGIGFAQLWSWGKDKNRAGIVLIAASAITIGFQYFAMNQYSEQPWWMLGVGFLFLAGSISMVVMKRLAYVTLLASMLIIPMYWTVMTVTANSNINLPTAYTGSYQQTGPGGSNRPNQQGGGPGSNVNNEMLAYLQTNTADVEYLAAVPSSQQGSQLVIATGRPVLYMGGFTGQDDVVTAENLSAMVANSELRYVLYGGDRGGKEDIANWLKISCSVVPEFSQSAPDNQPLRVQGPNGQQGPGNQAMTLFMCN